MLEKWGGGNTSLNISNLRIPCELLSEDQKNSLHIHFGISTTIIDNVQNRPLHSNGIIKELYFGKTNTNSKLKKSILILNNLVNFDSN